MSSVKTPTKIVKGTPAKQSSKTNVVKGTPAKQSSKTNVVKGRPITKTTNERAESKPKGTDIASKASKVISQTKVYSNKKVLDVRTKAKQVVSKAKSSSKKRANDFSKSILQSAKRAQEHMATQSKKVGDVAINGITKAAKNVENSSKNLVSNTNNLFRTAGQNLVDMSKSIAQNSKEAFHGITSKIGEDFSINIENAIASSFYKVNPILGFFASKLVNSEMLGRMKNLGIKTVSGVGNLAKNSYNALKAQKEKAPSYSQSGAITNENLKTKSDNAKSKTKKSIKNKIGGITDSIVPGVKGGPKAKEFTQNTAKAGDILATFLQNIRDNTKQTVIELRKLPGKLTKTQSNIVSIVDEDDNGKKFVSQGKPDDLAKLNKIKSINFKNTWKPTIRQFLSDYQRSSAIRSLNVREERHYKSKYGNFDESVDQGIIKSFIHAYKIASDSYDLSFQEKMLRALLEMKEALAANQKMMPLIKERLILSNKTVRNSLYTMQLLKKIYISPLTSIYRFFKRTRGGYTGNLPRGLGGIEHTATVLSMIYVDGMHRLDNIVHQLKRIYDINSQEFGTKSNMSDDASKGTWSIWGKLKDLFNTKGQDEKGFLKKGNVRGALESWKDKKLEKLRSKLQLQETKTRYELAKVKLREEKRKAKEKIKQEKIYLRNLIKEEKINRLRERSERWKENYEKFKIKAEVAKIKITSAIKNAPINYENWKDRTRIAGEAKLRGDAQRVKDFYQGSIDKFKQVKDNSKKRINDQLSVNEKYRKINESRKAKGLDSLTPRKVEGLNIFEKMLITSRGIAKSARIQIAKSDKANKLFLKMTRGLDAIKNLTKKTGKKVFGWIMTGIGFLKSMLGGILNRFLKTGIGGILKSVLGNLLPGGVKGLASLIRGAGVLKTAGIAGLAMGGMDAIGGVMKAKEWGTDKVSAGVGGFLGGSGEGGKLSAVKGVMKGASIGATIGSIFPGVGTFVGGAIGGLAGGILGMFGGKNIAKVLNIALKPIKWVAKGIHTFFKYIYMAPFNIIKYGYLAIKKVFTSIKEKGLLGSIKELTSWIYDKMKTLLKSLVMKPFNWFMSFFGKGKKDESKETVEKAKKVKNESEKKQGGFLSRWFGEDVKEKITNSAGNIAETAKKVGASAIQKTTDIAKGVRNTVAEQYTDEEGNERWRSRNVKDIKADVQEKAVRGYRRAMFNGNQIYDSIMSGKAWKETKKKGKEFYQDHKESIDDVQGIAYRKYMRTKSLAKNAIEAMKDGKAKKAALKRWQEFYQDHKESIDDAQGTAGRAVNRTKYNANKGMGVLSGVLSGVSGGLSGWWGKLKGSKLGQKATNKYDEFTKSETGQNIVNQYDKLKDIAKEKTDKTKGFFSKYFNKGKTKVGDIQDQINSSLKIYQTKKKENPAELQKEFFDLVTSIRWLRQNNLSIPDHVLKRTKYLKGRLDEIYKPKKSLMDKGKELLTASTKKIDSLSTSDFKTLGKKVKSTTSDLIGEGKGYLTKLAKNSPVELDKLIRQFNNVKESGIDPVMTRAKIAYQEGESKARELVASGRESAKLAAAEMNKLGKQTSETMKKVGHSVSTAVNSMATNIVNNSSNNSSVVNNGGGQSQSNQNTYNPYIEKIVNCAVI